MLKRLKKSLRGGKAFIRCFNRYHRAGQYKQFFFNFTSEFMTYVLATVRLRISLTGVTSRCRLFNRLTETAECLNLKIRPVTLFVIIDVTGL
jgi:hypothetical protein